MKSIIKISSIIGENKVLVKIPKRVEELNNLNGIIDPISNINLALIEDVIFNIVKEGIEEGGKWTDTKKLIESTIDVLFNLGQDFIEKSTEEQYIFEASMKEIEFKNDEKNIIETFEIELNEVGTSTMNFSYNLNSVSNNSIVWISVCIFKNLSNIAINKIKGNILKNLNTGEIDIDNLKKYITPIKSDTKNVIKLDEKAKDISIIGSLINYTPPRKYRYSLFKNADTDEVNAYLCKSKLNGMYFITWNSYGIDELMRESKVMNAFNVKEYIKEHYNKSITLELESFTEFLGAILKELEADLKINSNVLDYNICVDVKSDDEDIYLFDVYIDNIPVLKDFKSLWTLEKDYIEDKLIAALN